VSLDPASRAVDKKPSACKDNRDEEGDGGHVRDRLSQLLQTLENELRVQGRWEGAAPSPSALRSTQPFAVDTLTFDQWLQWMLLPKMNDLLLHQLPLPDNCAIHPMAEEVYDQEDAGAVRLISIIAEIDTLLTEGQGGLN
jgi:uncharacterized protein YqcC (DUF446 family)